VEADARGHGVGTRLVDECIATARAMGYARLTLWTNDVLVAARRIYQSRGFVLLSEERHQSFGGEQVGQYWALDL
jgi:GNAT superfamily N-acetyltransferase